MCDIPSRGVFGKRRLQRINFLRQLLLLLIRRQVTVVLLGIFILTTTSTLHWINKVFYSGLIYKTAKRQLVSQVKFCEAQTNKTLSCCWQTARHFILLHQRAAVMNITFPVLCTYAILFDALNEGDPIELLGSNLVWNELECLGYSLRKDARWLTQLFWQNTSMWQTHRQPRRHSNRRPNAACVGWQKQLGFHTTSPQHRCLPASFCNRLKSFRTYVKYTSSVGQSMLR